jgi:hypothetical protein
MAEGSQDTHPDGLRPEELRSDLSLLIEMSKDAKHDEQAVQRHLESLKTKLDKFVHSRGSHPGRGPAA